MLGMAALGMLYSGLVGGFIGSFLCFVANKQNNKFNMKMLEQYWNDDLYKMKNGILLAHSKIEEIEKKIPTVLETKNV